MWKWYYNPALDIIEHIESRKITTYIPSTTRSQTRSGQVYCAGEAQTDSIPITGLPVTVEWNLDGTITRREVLGPALAIQPSQPTDSGIFSAHGAATGCERR